MNLNCDPIKPISPEEFYTEMLKLSEYPYDAEQTHIMADNLMCRALRYLGYDAGVKVFEDLERWYS